MTANEDLRLYLLDMAEQLAELARSAGLTHGAAYLALAGMTLRNGVGGASAEEGDGVTKQQARR